MGTSDKFDGPSGVLVCTEDHIIYRHMDAPQHRVPIPRRHNPAGEERGLIIVAAVMHKMKVSSRAHILRRFTDVTYQGAFFFLLQSEDGDLFKVTIEHEDEDVKEVKIKYFDTVPVASALCILKSGFLFVASEFGNQSVIPLHLRSLANNITVTCTSFRSSVTTTTNPSSVPPPTLNSAWQTHLCPFPTSTSSHILWITSPLQTRSSRWTRSSTRKS